MLITEAFEAFRFDYICLRNLNRSTEENYELAVLSLTRAIGDIEVNEFTTAELMQWRRFMENRGNSISTIRGYISKLKNVLIYTNKKGWTSFDITDIHLPKTPPPLPKYLEADEIIRLIEGTSNIRDKAIIAVLFSSGMRAGELCRLEKNDLNGNMVFIRQAKGNTSRTVFVDDRSLMYINQYLSNRTDDSPLLFYSKKHGMLCHEALNRIIKKIAKEIGLHKDVHTHMLRHSFATNLIKNGCDISYVQKFLGHRFVSTTQIYIHLTGVDMHDAYLKFHKA